MASHGGLRLYLEAFAGSTYGRIAIATLVAITAWIGLTLAGYDTWWADAPVVVMSAVVAIPLARDVVVGLMSR